MQRNRVILSLNIIPNNNLDLLFYGNANYNADTNKSSICGCKIHKENWYIYAIISGLQSMNTCMPVALGKPQCHRKNV